MKNVIVSLFDDSGNLFDDWLAVGYELVLVDALNPPTPTVEGRVTRIQADLVKPFRLPPEVEARVAFASAHPPCDDLANSGNRWKQGKGLRALARSVDMFATAAEFCERVGAPYMIENPIGSMSTYWRKPDYVYQPHWYTKYDPRDNYKKGTCLWVGGGFVMPEKAADDSLGPPDNRIHFASPGPLRAYFRSVTPKGFGRASFLANCPLAGGTGLDMV